MAGKSIFISVCLMMATFLCGMYQGEEKASHDIPVQFSGAIGSEAADLPAMAGSGQVMSLTQAMMIDAKLRENVRELLARTDAPLSELLALADVILARWAGVDNIDPEEIRGAHWLLSHNYEDPKKVKIYRVYAYARPMAVLERFSGKPFVMFVDGEKTRDVHGTLMAQHKKVDYQTLRTKVALTLLSQFLLGKDVYDEVADKLDLDKIYTRLGSRLQNEVHPESISLLAVLVEDRRRFAFDRLDVSLLDHPAIRQGLQASGIVLNVDANGRVSGQVDDAFYNSSDGGILFGTKGDDTLHGSDVNDILQGGNGHDMLFGNKGNDVLYGGEGDDILEGGPGNDILYAGTEKREKIYGYDILVGGKDNDTLYGTLRGSTYIYTYGDGHDIIDDPGSIFFANDVLRLDRIALEDVRVERVGNDMRITVEDLTRIRESHQNRFDEISGSILIKNGFDCGRMEYFRFSDNYYMQHEELLQRTGFLSDVYEQNPHPAVFEIDDPGGKADTLVFAQGVRPQHLVVRPLADRTLVIAMARKGPGPDELWREIVIQKGLLPDHRIEQYRFDGGTELTLEEILALQRGTPGDDLIIMLDSNDILDGGAGNDHLEGGGGNDTYLFRSGSGRDTLFDAAGLLDQVRFGEGITPDDLVMTRDGNDMVIALRKEGAEMAELPDPDVVILKNWHQEPHRIERMVFDTGDTSLGIVDILRMSGQNPIVGDGEQGQTLIGTDGNDIIVAGPGHDVLRGRGGHDELNGGGGDDQLDGGPGNDRLYGGQGNDIYFFGRGSGRDEIFDAGSIAAVGGDMLAFDADINLSDLLLRRSGDDLVISLIQPGVAASDFADQVCIRSWFVPEHRLEVFTFENGSTLLTQDILPLISPEV